MLVDKSLFINDLKDNYREMARFGITPKDAPFFLPPYEWYNRTIAKWTRELGLKLINFSHGTRSNADYTWPEMGDKYVNSEVIYQSILDYERTSPNGLNGFILLLHIGTDPARTDKFYLKLENLIDELMSKGYQFSTIAF
ncbi:MAG: hypothetical protein R3C26_13905 [Calditrichia bacterium]